MQAVDQGVVTMYDHPPPRQPHALWDSTTRRWVVGERALNRICNHPPAAAYLLWASGAIHRVVEPNRLVNTVRSHAVFSLWGILADVVLAWGCAAIVSLLRGRTAADLTLATILFLPPLWWSTCIWGHPLDSVMAAAAVCMVLLTVRGRWLAAGCLWGVCFGLKTQALLFAPLWLFACIAVADRRRQILLGGLSAIGVLTALSTPFMVHSGLAWLRCAYLGNLVDSPYSALTTLKAFNLWYLDLLIGGSADAGATALGVTKNTWGVTAALLGLGICLAVAVRRWKNNSRALPIVATLGLVVPLMTATQMHERYLLIALPYLVVSAALTKRFLLPAVLLSCVAMAQITWPHWLSTPPGGEVAIRHEIREEYARALQDRPQTVEFEPLELREERAVGHYRMQRTRTAGWELMLTTLALAGFALTLRALWKNTSPTGLRAPGGQSSMNRVLLYSGVCFAVLAATAYCILEVHHSTDTWIALAAGRHIQSSEGFPVADNFSYTFNGAIWFNQNWLSHVVFWELYDRVGEAAPVIATWFMGIAIIGMLLLACGIRSRAWFLSIVTCSFAAYACRSYFGIRPATISYLLLAATWLALHGLLSDRNSNRRWPWLVLAGALLAWPHTHGSFVFGFGLVVLFLLCTGVEALVDRSRKRNLRHAAALVLVLLVCGVSGAALSPFGWQNFLHPTKVAGSDVFRQINEWLPPFAAGRYPPVLGFWVALAAGLAAVATAAVAGRPGMSESDPERQAGSRFPLAAALFDAASVGLGLAMVFWARRFVPVFCILTAPAIAALLARMTAGMNREAVLCIRRSTAAAAWLTALALACTTWAWAVHDYCAQTSARSPGFPHGLLGRATQMADWPLDSIDFLRNNRIRARVFSDWKLGGPLMFWAPESRVFIDGRSQQVYSEQHYRTYHALVRMTSEQRHDIESVLDRYRTEIVVLPRWSSMRTLTAALQSSDAWFPLLIEARGVTAARRGTNLVEELGRREHVGALWWPRTPEALAGRATLLTAIQSPDNEASLALWLKAVERKPTLGTTAYPAIADAYSALGRTDEALAYFSLQMRSVARSGGFLTPEQQHRLTTTLENAAQRCNQGSEPENQTTVSPDRDDREP